jgi:hypothetical protein
MKFFTDLLCAAGVTAVTTALPKSAGSNAIPTAIRVKGSFDGKMMKYDHNREYI